jgi:hypothetical protein
MENIAKQVKILKIYAAILTLVVIAFIAYTLYLNNRHDREITAERINIVEKDGTLRMVISNRERQHPGRIDNKDYPARERPAGMIFFNDEGDENGGLIYEGNKKGAGMFYSVDQYKNDQVMQLQYEQEKEHDTIVRRYGLNIWDRNDDFTLTKQIALVDSLKKLNDTSAYNAGIKKFLAAGYHQQRLFVGKNKKGEVGLFLNDANGKPRLNIYINKQNQPVIETLNDKGEIIGAR